MPSFLKDYGAPYANNITISDNQTGLPFTANAVKLLDNSSDEAVYFASNADVGSVRVFFNATYMAFVGFINPDLSNVHTLFGYTWRTGDNTVSQWELYPTTYPYQNGVLQWRRTDIAPTNLGFVYPLMSYTSLETYIASAWAQTAQGGSVNPSPVVSDSSIEQKTIVVRVTAMPSDTNDEGGISDYAGGDGTFDDNSDNVPLPNMPTISAANSGLISIFRPSLNELKSLGSYLWTNIGDVPDNIKKLFSNPMDYFIAFHIVPCYPDVGESRTIKIGLWDTTISMPPVLSQWQELDFGSITIPLYWGSALDYAPYTKISMFLPFIGSVSLNTDEVMNQSISLKYRVDLVSGQCVACILVGNDALYQFTGECSISVPLTGADWSRVYQAIVGAGVSVASGTAIGLTNAAVGAEYSAAATTAGQMAASNAANRANAIAMANITHGITNAVSNVISGKQQIQHSGSISGSAGLLGNRTPYVLIEYPNQSLPKDYKHFMGYPSNVYARLSELSGYTVCEQVIAQGIPCTDNELAEIIETLKGGVYL